MSAKLKRMIFFVGPTGVGKSSHAHTLALKYQASILNCDSIQMYQEVSVGSAKPTAKDMTEVPHHLVNAIAPPKVWTAADFHRQALKILEKELPQRDVFAVGGSGFYIRALEKGLYELPALDAEKEQQIKAQLNLKTDLEMHDELKGIDAETAQRLHVNDRYRVERALVIWHGFQIKPSQVQKEFVAQPLPYENLKIGLTLERETLRDILAERIEKMNAEGFREEVEALLAKGLEDWWPLKSVGYQEWVDVILRGAPESEVVQKILTSHMQLAKKQMTWFKKDQTILWLHTHKDQNKLVDVVQQFLATGVNPCKV